MKIFKRFLAYQSDSGLSEDMKPNGLPNIKDAKITFEFPEDISEEEFKAHFRSWIITISTYLMETSKSKKI